MTSELQLIPNSHQRRTHSLVDRQPQYLKPIASRVRFGFPSEMPALENLDGRYAVEAFDQMIASLPRESTHTF